MEATDGNNGQIKRSDLVAQLAAELAQLRRERDELRDLVQAQARYIVTLIEQQRGPLHRTGART